MSYLDRTNDAALNSLCTSVHGHDVNRRLHVTSDLNRATNTEFNKQGIEIPFPQRDVNFRGPLQMEAESTAPPQAPDGGELPRK